MQTEPANEIVASARIEIGKGGTSSTSGVADKIREAFISVRKKHVIQQELEPRGLNLGSYYSGQRNLMPDLVQIIDNAFKAYNPRVELIVAGQDVVGQDYSECHMYTISNPGILNCYDCIGYTAIGSGAPHAIYSLIEANYVKSLDKSKAVEYVQKAKERSQVAPGVGTKTRLMPALVGG